MDIIKLSTRTRTGQGKGYARRLRAAGWIPAISYSHGKEASKLEVEARDFAKVVRGKKTTHIMDIGFDGKEDLAVIKELQRDVIQTEYAVHIDFQKISVTEKITVYVPLDVVGLPIGVKDDGGILEHPIRQLHIRCLPMDIPEKITVDVSHLKINQSMHVRELVLEKIEIVSSPEEVIAVVSIPAKEEAVQAAAAVAAEGAEGATPAAGAEGGDAAKAGGDAGGDKKPEKKAEKKAEKK